MKNLQLSAAFFLLSLLFGSCTSDQEPEKPDIDPEDIFEISTEELYFQEGDSMKTFMITSNRFWSIKKEGGGWALPDKTSGMGNDTIRVRVIPLDSISQNRQMYLNVTLSSGVEKKVKLMQDLNRFISVSERSFSLHGLPQMVQVQVSSNLEEYDVLSSDESWVTVSQKTKSGRQGTLQITVKGNETGKSRQAYILLGTPAKDSVMITQRNFTGESDYLMDIYTQLGGKNWTTQTNWCTEKPLNQWHGVKTDPQGMVTELDLSDVDSVQGTVSEYINKLTQLRVLKLNGSYKSADLSALVNLEIFEAKIEGTDNEILNKLARIKNLTSITILNSNLDEDLSACTILSSKKLKYISMPRCGIRGTLGSEIAAAKSLEYLDLAHNNLSGSIPQGISEATSLKHLNLSLNNITGKMPENLGKQYIYLNLGSNDFQGPIPLSISLLSELEYLDLSRFETPNAPQAMPEWICNLTKLKTLNLRNLSLTGVIPQDINNMTELKWIDLSFNKLTGSIPAGVGLMTNLSEMFLSDNSLSGSIPQQVLDHPNYAKWVGSTTGSSICHQNGDGFDNCK